MATYATVSKKQSFFQLDIRDYFTFLEAPSLIEIQTAVRKAIPEDPGIIIRPLNGRLVGVYQVITIVNPENLMVAFTCDGPSTVSVPITKFGGARGPREGTLVTIVDGNVGESHMIPCSEFDTAFSEYGEVIKPTCPQRFNKTDFLNGNLMVVVKQNDKILPDRLLIRGQSLLLKYKGKVWNCSSCKVEHTGPCPYLKRFYELKDKRKEEGVGHFIMADSTLRYAEQVGLRADVACISGATVGQIAHAAIKGSKGLKDRGLAIVAGANDCEVYNSFTELEVAKKIDLSLSRLQPLVSSSVPVTIMNSAPPGGIGSPLDEFSKRYFDARLESICSANEHLSLAKCTEYLDTWVEGHPTQRDTEVMLQALTQHIPDLILDPDFTTSKGIYRGVVSGWKSGCSGCPTTSVVRGKFCAQCYLIVTDPSIKCYDGELLNKIKNDLLNYSFGQLKRHLEPSGEDDDDDDANISTKKPQYD